MPDGNASREKAEEVKKEEDIGSTQKEAPWMPSESSSIISPPVGQGKSN